MMIRKFGALLLVLLSGSVQAAENFSASRARADFENRLGSVQALGEAFQREALRQGKKDGGILALVTARRLEAEKLAQSGDIEAARGLLDEGYRTLTQALAELQNARQEGGMTGMSGPINPGQTGMAGMSEKVRANELETRLNSLALMSEALRPRAAEPRVRDTLTRTGQLTQEARKLAASDPDRALALVREALELVKSAM